MLKVTAGAGFLVLVSFAVAGGCAAPPEQMRVTVGVFVFTASGGTPP